jgi:hypothetical protein
MKRYKERESITRRDFLKGTAYGTVGWPWDWRA